MKLEFIPKVITLLAGAIVCIITIVNDYDTTYSLALVLITLIVFYIIGQIAKKIIQKTMEGNMFVKRHGGGQLVVPMPKDSAEADTETKDDNNSENTELNE